MTNVVLVFCEGKNDLSFLAKLLEQIGSFRVVDDPLEQLKGMYFDSFLEAKFSESVPRKRPVVMQDGDVLYLLYDLGGKDKVKLIEEAINGARFISQEESHLPGLRFSFALIFDADYPNYGGGFEVRRSELNRQLGVLLPQLLSDSPMNHLCFEVQDERLGLFIFPRNGDDGALEDLAMDTLEEKYCAKVPLVGNFLSSELKGLSAKSELSNPGKLKKAVLTALVQAESPGSSVDVALKKLARSDKMRTNPHCQALLTMLRHLGRPWV